MRLVVILLFFISCSPEHKKTQHSFYYWKTTFTPDSNTIPFINKENIDHFYIHYFDVAWSYEYNMPVPLAEISGFNNAGPFINKQYTPVVFITNSCFERMKISWTDSLAVKISNRIKFITGRLEKSKAANNRLMNDSSNQYIADEVQIDCDWTASTKEKYFDFLRSLKKLLPGKKLSATIRLYPYKYPNLMGIPPVDKGLLMCYNMTDIKDNENPNSVFSISALKQYLNANPYPLPLDIALPVFGWYAWFSGGQFKNIIYPDPGDPMIRNNNSLKTTGNNITLLTDTMMNNNYLRQGDILRIEYPDPAELEAAAKILYEKFPVTGRICFYYWDKNLIKQYEKTISHIYTGF